jgi:6-phosphogluconolactonase
MTAARRQLFAGTFPDGPGTVPLGPESQEAENYDLAKLGARISSIDLERSDAPLVTELGPPYVDAAYLAGHPDLPVLYAVNRSPEGGAVSAWTIGPGLPAELSLLSVVDSGGAEPCHVAVSPDGRHLLVANYRGPTVSSYVLADDGSVSEHADVVRHDGHGLDPSRQESAHPHMVVVDPVTRHVLVCDLGADRVVAYGLDSRGRLTPLPDASTDISPGAGPRHAVFAAGGKALLVLNELNSTVALLCRNGHGFRVADVIRTIPYEHVRNHPSAIRLSANDHLAYVANRGHDSITTLEVSPDGASLRIIGNSPCGGRPRDIVLDAEADRLLIANLPQDTVASMRLSSTGLPDSAEEMWTVPNVSSLVICDPDRNRHASPYNLR